jgi:multidrug resistance efflux pump
MKTVAPKVSGRIENLAVDMADTVTRGQLVARLDNDEYLQAVARAEAELAVARANLAEARSRLETADRELNRIGTLRQRGVASESRLDAAKAEQVEAQARVIVAGAQVSRASAFLETELHRYSGRRPARPGWNC